MMKILITGSSGFIGNNLCQQYANLGQTYLGIDLVPNSKNKQLNSKILDCKDKKGLQNLKSDFDPEIVIHLAARTDLLGSRIEDYDDNTVGTQNVLEVFNNSRVVVASSRLVFDPHRKEPLESFEYSPTTQYGESKVIAENLALRYGATIVRPTSIWGPNSGPPFATLAKLISKNLYYKARDKEVIKTMGYVSNTSAQLRAISESEYISTPINLGDEDLNLHRFADMISYGLHKRRCNELSFSILESFARIGDYLEYVGIHSPLTSNRLKNIYNSNTYNLNEVHQICGYPKITLDDAIAEYVTFLKNSKG
jgi:nucleoside-diphosphate-sugar epimerase